MPIPGVSQPRARGQNGNHEGYGSGPLAYELLTEGPKERSKMEGEQWKGVIDFGSGRTDKEEPICQGYRDI